MAYRRTQEIQDRLDATRARIVETATALIAEQGFAGCSVAQVADAAGIATGSVYKHFPNKGALFAEVFRTHTQREVDAVAEASAKPGTIEAAVMPSVSQTPRHRSGPYSFRNVKSKSYDMHATGRLATTTHRLSPNDALHRGGEILACADGWRSTAEITAERLCFLGQSAPVGALDLMTATMIVHCTQ